MDSINIITANDYYNGLIAEYMDMIFDDNDKSMMIVKTPQGNDIIYLDELKYHTSWDWLMPVVGKISRDERFLDNEYRETLLDVVPYGRIQDVVDAVANFILHVKK